MIRKIDKDMHGLICSSKDSLDRHIAVVKHAKSLLGKQYTVILPKRKTPTTFVTISYDYILGDFICCIVEGKNTGKEFEITINQLRSYI